MPIHKLRRNEVSLRATVSSDAFINRSHIGDYVYIGPKASVDVAEIGSYTCVSGVVAIGGMNHAYDKSFSINPLVNEHCTYDVKTYIGHDCWLGSRCVIMQGVHVGDGAVIGAGAIVTKDVPENTIVTGVPARPYKKRYPDELWERIKGSGWWNLPPAEAKLLMSEIEKEIDNKTN